MYDVRACPCVCACVVVVATAAVIEVAVVMVGVVVGVVEAAGKMPSPRAPGQAPSSCGTLSKH